MRRGGQHDDHRDDPGSADGVAGDGPTLDEEVDPHDDDAEDRGDGSVLRAALPEQRGDDDG